MGEEKVVVGKAGAWLKATGVKSFVAVDSKTTLKGRNTPSKRTSCTTFKRRRESLAPEIKFIPVGDALTGDGQFFFPGFLPFLPPHPPNPFENHEKKSDYICGACVTSL